MNPGLFLDAYKNDMHIFIHTQGTENNMSVLFLESLTVQDLPLNTPFTIGVVCNGSTLEVYLNCSLYSTMMLKGKSTAQGPYTRQVLLATTFQFSVLTIWKVVANAVVKSS